MAKSCTWISGSRAVVGLCMGLACLIVGVAGCASHAPWHQWGGPDRNFMVEADELADAWITLLSDEGQREEMGSRARKVAFRDANAGRRTARALSALLS